MMIDKFKTNRLDNNLSKIIKIKNNNFNEIINSNDEIKFQQ